MNTPQELLEAIEQSTIKSALSVRGIRAIVVVKSTKSDQVLR